MKPANKLTNMVDGIAKEIVSKLTPREIGKTLYPDATPVEYSCIPEDVKEDHLTRYSEAELQNGHFFEALPGKYVFIMRQKSYSSRQNRKNPGQN